PEAVIRSITVAAGLGTTSAYTWLKLPVVDDMERVLAASMLPVLLLGGEVSADQDAAFARWRKALQIPSVHGLVIGRSVLFPPDDDVASAVDTVLSIVQGWGQRLDDKFYLRRGTSQNGAFSVVVTPERAGWTYSGLKVLTLPP